MTITGNSYRSLLQGSAATPCRAIVPCFGYVCSRETTARRRRRLPTIVRAVRATYLHVGAWSYWIATSNNNALERRSGQTRNALSVIMTCYADGRRRQSSSFDSGVFGRQPPLNGHSPDVESLIIQWRLLGHAPSHQKSCHSLFC